MTAGAAPEAAEQRVAVVVATRNRRERLLATLPRLTSLPERPRVVVVDNGSDDGTAEAVARHHPEVDLVVLADNRGGGGRTVGALAVDAPYVAFSDDDSWWAPGSLSAAADLLDCHPRLALVMARVLVGPERRPDPICAEMAASPLPRRPDLPGHPVLGFLACAVVVRRSSFLAVGGFDTRFGIGGEEEVVALDLADGGWDLAYVDHLVAHHHPVGGRDPAPRRRVQTRNALWATWLRWPSAAAARRTLRLLRPGVRDAAVRRGVLDAVLGAAWALGERRPVGEDVQRALRALGD